eukprot:COSAG01_NODE_5517_length_4207_cov_25.282376_3_plen_362_part_00
MGALVMFDGRDTHDSNVKVVCRVRPLNEREASSGAHAAVVVRSDRVVSVSGSRLGKQYTQRFEFDRALDGRVQQPQFFEGSGVRRMLDAALEGYGATIFAYGQTGSGKTHTMFGSSVSGGTDGIIPRAIEYLYLRARQLSGTAGEMVGVGGGGGARCSLRSSFCEIYNEQVYDLLNPQASPGHDGRMLPRSLHVRQSDSSGFLVQDLFVVACEDTEDMTAVVAEGVANRHVSNHAMNKDSSRSHALFTIEIDVEGGGAACASRQGLLRGLGGVGAAARHALDGAGAEGGRLHQLLAIRAGQGDLGAVGGRGAGRWRLHAPDSGGNGPLPRLEADHAAERLPGGSLAGVDGGLRLTCYQLRR